MNHAQKFIEKMRDDLDKNNSNLYENIVIRIDQKYAAMITVLGALLKFPTSTAFTDILSDHLFDMVISINETKYNEIIENALNHINHLKPNETPTSSTANMNKIDRIIGDAFQDKYSEIYKFRGTI